MGILNAAGPATEYGEPTPNVEQLGGELDQAHSTKPINSQATRRQLGAVLRDLKDETRLSLKDLTVLSAVNDPFRLDTATNHRDGEWLQKQMQGLGYLRPGTSIHNRGLHYALVATGGLILPNGRPYINDLDCWDWLEGASKAARWLGCMAHKLRALQISQFDRLRFQLHAPALTVEQVKALGLPSTPLKETELRADGWRRRYGVEQTEIDALATLQPDVLRGIVRHAVDPFFDRTLASRIYEAEREARDWAEEQLQDRLADNYDYQDARAEANSALNALNEAWDRLSEIVDSVDLVPPEQDPIEAEIGDTPPPLVSSDMPLVEAIRILRGRKDYGGGQ
jgi:hypothetical protein